MDPILLYNHQTQTSPGELRGTLLMTPLDGQLKEQYVIYGRGNLVIVYSMPPKGTLLKIACKFEIPNCNVTSLELSKDSKFLLVGCNTGQVLVFGINKGFIGTPVQQRPFCELQVPKRGAVMSIAIEALPAALPSGALPPGGDSGRASPSAGTSHDIRDCLEATNYLVAVVSDKAAAGISSWILRLGCNDCECEFQPLPTIRTKVSAVHLLKVDDAPDEKIVLFGTGVGMSLHRFMLQTLDFSIIKWNPTPSIPSVLGCCFTNGTDSRLAVVNHSQRSVGSKVVLYDVRQLLSSANSSADSHGETFLDFGVAGKSVLSIQAPSTIEETSSGLRRETVSRLLLLTESDNQQYLQSWDIATKTVLWSRRFTIARYPRNIAACPVGNLIAFSMKDLPDSPTHIRVWKCPGVLKINSNSLACTFGKQTELIAMLSREVSTPLQEAIRFFATEIPTEIEADWVDSLRNKYEKNTKALLEQNLTGEALQQSLQLRTQICNQILRCLEESDVLTDWDAKTRNLRKLAAQAIAHRQSMELARQKLGEVVPADIGAPIEPRECDDAYALLNFMQQHAQLITTVNQPSSDTECQDFIQVYCAETSNAQPLVEERLKSTLSDQSQLLRSWYLSTLQVWPLLSRRMDKYTAIQSQLHDVSKQLKNAKSLVCSAKEVLDEEKEREAQEYSRRLKEFDQTLAIEMEKLSDAYKNNRDLNDKFVWEDYTKDLWFFLLVALLIPTICWLLSLIDLYELTRFYIYAILISLSWIIFKSKPVQKVFSTGNVNDLQRTVSNLWKESPKLYGQLHKLDNFPQFHHEDTMDAISQRLGCERSMMDKFSGSFQPVRSHIEGTSSIPLCNVYHLKLRETGAEFGLKEFNKDVHNRLWRTEMHIRAIVGPHPNILPISYIVTNFGKREMIYLATPWKKYSLAQWKTDLDQRSRDASHVELIHYVISQMVVAVTHLHEHGVRHKDLKLWNFLIDENDQVFLCDFANSRTEDSQPDYDLTSQPMGSRHFQDPETQATGRQCRFSDDVYSLGLCMYALLKSTPDDPYPPTSFTNAREVHDKVRNFLENPNLDSFSCSKCAKLILRMIHPRRGCRPALVPKENTEEELEELERAGLGTTDIATDLVGAWLNKCKDEPDIPFQDSDPSSGSVQVATYERQNHHTGLEFVHHERSFRELKNAKIFSDGDAALAELIQVRILRSKLQEASYDLCFKQFCERLSPKLRLSTDPPRASDQDMLDHICNKYPQRIANQNENDAEKPMEWTLFHGTSSMDAAESILRQGMRVLKRTDDLWYGSGYYLTPDLSYARQYGPVVLVFRVVTCKHFSVMKKDDRETSLKPGIDTNIVIVDRETGLPIPRDKLGENEHETTEFCIREAQQAKPVFLFQFMPGLAFPRHN